MKTPRHVSDDEPLTQYQKRLGRELYEIYDILSLDFYDIKAYPKEARTTCLDLMKRAVVRAEVVTTYTLVDEYLNVFISLAGRRVFRPFGKQKSSGCSIITSWKNFSCCPNCGM